MPKQRDLRPWRSVDPCPCGTELSYGECCEPRSVIWQRDGRGNPFRSIEIAPEFQKYIFEQPLRKFRHVFRRDPGPNDRVDPYTYVTDPEEFEANFIEAAESSGIDPAIVYAFRKTGRIMMEGVSDRLPQKYVDEWNEAVEEYHASLNDPAPAPSAIDEKMSRVMDEAVRLPFLFGKLLADVNQRAPGKLRKRGFPAVFALFCAARTAKSLQAIRTLMETQAAEDSLTIVRSMYEGYLHCIGTLREPGLLEEVQKAKGGVHAGTHRHPRNRKGRTNFRIAVDVATGERLCADLSIAKLAALSPHPEDMVIYGELYSYLSRFAHPHVVTIPQFLGEAGFTSKNRELVFEAFLLANVVGSLVLDAMVQLPIPRETRADLRRFLRHANKAFTDFFAEVHRLETPSSMQLALEGRVRKMGRPWPFVHPK